jgi:threonine synthase
MNVISTRRGATDLPLADALLGGTAPDGGLFVPARLPSGETLRGATLPDSALAMLAPFFAGDRLESELPAMLVEAFTFPAPLVPLRDRGDFVVELFHGPTAAFKDFGARFLAACMRRLHPPGAGTRTVLVATSGHRRRGRGGLPPHARRPSGALSTRTAACHPGRPTSWARRERHRAASGRHVSTSARRW